MHPKKSLLYWLILFAIILLLLFAFILILYVYGFNVDRKPKEDIVSKTTQTLSYTPTLTKTPGKTISPSNVPSQTNTTAPTLHLPSPSPTPTLVPTRPSTPTPTRTARPSPSVDPSRYVYESAYYDESENYRVDLVAGREYYDFPVKDTSHAFTHDLIAFPELNLQYVYTSDFDDCLTTNEFSKVLKSLYDRNYILIDINYIYEYSIKDGKPYALLKDTIKLPKGKKAFILSVDNVTFDAPTKSSGRISKLVIDNGNLSGYKWFRDNTSITARNIDLFCILQSFVEAHPDFSFANAKCTLALSAYCGILGYRTDSTYKDHVSERQKAAKVIKWLKDNGFNFACHSYSHLNASTCSYDELKRDLENWEREVTPLIGKTRIYVYPFGAVTHYNTPNTQLLFDSGYIMFCGTSFSKILRDTFPNSTEVGHIYCERLIFCGITLYYYHDSKWFDPYFNVYEVYDNDSRLLKISDETPAPTPTRTPTVVTPNVSNTPSPSATRTLIVVTPNAPATTAPISPTPDIIPTVPVNTPSPLPSLHVITE